MQALSLFSSARWTREQVDRMLRIHFYAEDDDYNHGDYPHGKSRRGGRESGKSIA